MIPMIGRLPALNRASLVRRWRVEVPKHSPLNNRPARWTEYDPHVSHHVSKPLTRKACCRPTTHPVLCSRPALPWWDPATGGSSTSACVSSSSAWASSSPNLRFPCQPTLIERRDCLAKTLFVNQFPGQDPDRSLRQTLGSHLCHRSFVGGPCEVLVASCSLSNSARRDACVSRLFVSSGVACVASSCVDGLSVCVSRLFVGGGAVCVASTCAAWFPSVCFSPFLAKVKSASSVGAAWPAEFPAPASAASRPKGPAVSAGALARASSQLSAVGTVLCCNARSPATTDEKSR